jgi:hypothetical protein
MLIKNDNTGTNKLHPSSTVFREVENVLSFMNEQDFLQLKRVLLLCHNEQTFLHV